MNNIGRPSLAAISLLFLLFFAPAYASAEPECVLTLNVRDFGAAGDGKTKDTAAIRQTLDRCSVPKGAVAIPAPQLPEPVTAPSKPYQLR